MASWIRRRRVLASAIAVGLLGACGLSLIDHAHRLPLPRHQAIAAALRSDVIHRALAGVRWDSAEVDAVDPRLERVTFLEGGQVLGEVAVRPDGTIQQGINFRHLAVPYGDWISYQPAILIGLAALFALITGVAPWRRMRNLDVLSVLSLVAPILLLQHRYVDASVLVSLPGLLYLLVRCAFRALGPPAVLAPSVPLLDVIASGWDVRRKVRLLRVLLAALALLFVMVTVSSVDAVDVLYAVMEGATKLLGGVLPYGHMPGDVIHGDTYPLLSYALYAPLAWLSPVRSVWDSVDLPLAATVGAALATGWAVFRTLAGSGRGVTGRSPEQEAAGLRAAVTWLAFPPVLVIASSGTSDVVLAAMLAMALLLWRRPAVCTALLAAAAWFKLAPVALLPLRLVTLRGRHLAVAAGAIAVVSVPMVGLLLALGGANGPLAMLHAISFQFSRGSPQSVWAVLSVQALQPAGEAAVLALLAAAVLQLRARPEWAEDRTRMAALAAAMLIGMQLAANYWAFLYLVWVVPLLGMSLLGERAPEPASERADVTQALLPERRPAGAMA